MIQRQQQRKTIVKRAEFGWGLFAAEHIAANEFIMDYVGEIYHGGRYTTGTTRYLLESHFGRAYTFVLSKYVEIDAAYAGNPSRLINDPRPHDHKTNTYVKST